MGSPAPPMAAYARNKRFASSSCALITSSGGTSAMSDEIGFTADPVDAAQRAPIRRFQDRGRWPFNEGNDSTSSSSSLFSASLTSGSGDGGLGGGVLFCGKTQSRIQKRVYKDKSGGWGDSYPLGRHTRVTIAVDRLGPTYFLSK